MNATALPLIMPPHVHYLMVTADLVVVQHSTPLPVAIATTSPPADADVRDYFPELWGCEDIFVAILAGEMPDFNLKGVTRTTTAGENFYFDIYIQAYTGRDRDLLLIFVEDVTDKMTLEQVLVQSTNEANLLLSALTNSRNYTERIVTSIADALIVTTPQHEIKQVNQATANLFGYTIAELVGQPLSILLLPPQDILTTVDQMIATPGDERATGKPLEALCQTKNGSQLRVALSCSLIATETRYQELDTQPTPDVVYIGRDVTERQRTQQRLAAQYAIANILSESNSLDGATYQILGAIGDSLEWDVGEFWTPQNECDRKAALPNKSARWQQQGDPCAVPVPKLHRVELWTSSPVTRAHFLDNYELNHAEGIRFAGRVWSAGVPQWITALKEDPDFGRASAIVSAKLRSAFAFPIYNGNEMFGVMTFYRYKQQPPDEHLLQMLTATGNQLGQFMKRKEAEIALHQQQAQTERLLRNILPNPIVERLKASADTIADTFEEVTVLFADIVGFTKLATQLSAIELVEQLNVVFSAFDELSDRHGLEKIKTIGDAYMVVGGLPQPNVDHAIAIAEMALDMQERMAHLNLARKASVGIRIGINTGPVVAGVIGMKKFSYDLWGDTVNIASRMESHGEPGRIQVSASTYERLCDRYHLTPRGQIPVKGRGEMLTYWLLGRQLCPLD